MNSLKDKTIIVTGGGRGIGAAACKLLADEGANVIVTCRTTDEGLSIEKDILFPLPKEVADMRQKKNG